MKIICNVLSSVVKFDYHRGIEKFDSGSLWENMSSQFVTTSLTKRPKSALPFAFSEQGVSMLSAVLRSSVAINISIQIMRAFVMVRQMLTNQPVGGMHDLKQEIVELKVYMDEVLTDQNDINEDIRMQLELINQTIKKKPILSGR